MSKKQIKNSELGVTLVALVITIIVLIILAGVTLSVNFGDSGIIGNGLTAKEKAEIANEKEILECAVIGIVGTSKTGEITLSKLYEKLEGYNIEIIEQNKFIIVTFKDMDRWYQIDADGNVSYLDVKEAKIIKLKYVQEDIKGVRTPIPNKKDDEYKLIFEDYSIVPPKIEGYEPALEVVEGSAKGISEIEILYYLVYDEDELVFTEITVDGEIQYMVGDNTSNYSNGIKSTVDKTIKSVVRIPETYNGKLVTQIGPYAFNRLSNIIKVNTGDNVIDILGYAFHGSSKMVEFTIGKKVESIESHSFWGCNSVNTIIFKNEDIKIADSFMDLTSWTQIKEESSAYIVKDNVLYSSDGKTLLIVPRGRSGEFIINNGVEKINRGAFYQCKKITKVLISDSVTSIGLIAFAQSGIQSVVIGKGIEKEGSEIGDRIFQNCTSLKNVTFRNSNVVSLSGAFAGCSAWTEIQLDSEDTMRKVQNNILYSNDGTTIVRCSQENQIENLIIDSSITKVENYAFYRCSKIQSLTIVGNKKNGIYLGEASFGTTKINKITIGEDVKISDFKGRAFLNSNSISTVVIDSLSVAEGITSSGSAGRLVYSVPTIYIKEDITSVGSYITSNFTKQETSDMEGYVKYLRNT